MLAGEFREGGITVTVVPADGESPAQMILPLSSTVPDRHLRIHTYFLPDIDDPPIAQYFVALPYVVEPDGLDGLARFVCAVNASLPLTGFEIAVADLAVAFRHTHAVGIRPLDPGVIAWSLTMIRSAIEQFGDLVEAVASGFDVSEAMLLLGQRVDEDVEP